MNYSIILYSKLAYFWGNNTLNHYIINQINIHNIIYSPYTLYTNHPLYINNPYSYYIPPTILSIPIYYTPIILLAHTFSFLYKYYTKLNFIPKNVFSTFFYFLFTILYTLIYNSHFFQINNNKIN